MTSIFPTPKFLAATGKTIPIAEKDSLQAAIIKEGDSIKENLAAKMIQDRILELSGLKIKVLKRNEVAGVPRAIRLSCSPRNHATRLNPKDKETLAKSDQAYLIKTVESGILLLAADPQGLLYAAVSLIQLFRKRARNIFLPAVYLRDFPDFQYRAASNWLLIQEIDTWAYDFGEGLTGYKKRIKAKLDWCLYYKINMVWFEGFGWAIDKTPGYAAMMRELNRYARERGIKLVFGGYGACYSWKFYNGTKFKNRAAYPRGKLYRCMGHPYWEHEKEGSFDGTCWSNEALNKLKAGELARFVREIEPGALYIHHLDLSTYQWTSQSWQQRCPRCKKKWPDNIVESKTGEAGADSHGYSTLAGAVARVRKKNYDGAADCLVMLGSPLYTAYEESDRVWDGALIYWENVSALMRLRKNIVFLFREQFFNQQGTRRIPQMVKALKKNGHNAFVISFGGGCSYLNGSLFVASSVMNNFFLGSAGVCNANGNSLQEPLQIFNSEWCWNAASSFEKPNSYGEAIARFEAYVKGTRRPQAIYGSNGLLRRICNKFYGVEAGKYMHKVYAAWKNNEGPLALWRRLVKNEEIQWQQMKLKPDELKKRLALWTKQKQLTVQAGANVNKALACAGLNDNARENLRWLYKNLKTGEYFSAILMAVYKERLGRASPLRKELARLDRYLKANFSRNTVDHRKALVGITEYYLNYLKKLRPTVD